MIAKQNLNNDSKKTLSKNTLQLSQSGAITPYLAVSESQSKKFEIMQIKTQIKDLTQKIQNSSRKRLRDAEHTWKDERITSKVNGRDLFNGKQTAFFTKESLLEAQASLNQNTISKNPSIEQQDLNY